MRVAFSAFASVICLICMVSGSSLFDNDVLESDDRHSFRCRDGSFFVNGSCYFISNRKQLPASRFWPSSRQLARERKEKSHSPNLINTKDLLRTQFVAASIPRKDNWEAARSHCSKLNNDSSIIVIESDSEFESLIDLLFKLNSANLATKNPEAIYFIGLRYINSTWKWTNGNPLTYSSLVQLQIDPNLNDYNGARTCASLNLNADGHVTIELLNCQIMPAPFICKYTVDRCYNNGQCSKNGECINSPQTKSFECRCRAFYAGSRCEKWSNQGIQMLISVSLVIIALVAAIIYKFFSYLKSIKKRRIEDENNALRPSLVFTYGLELLFDSWKMLRHILIKKKKLVILIVSSFFLSVLVILCASYARYKMIELRIEIFKNKISRFLNPHLAENAHNKTDQLEASKKQATEQFQRLASTFTRFFSIDFCATAKQRFMEDYMFCVISLPLTAFIYLWSLFRCRSTHSCGRIAKNPNKAMSGNSMLQNLGFRICHFLDRMRKLRIWCCCEAEFPVPMNPFSKRNRFMTAIVYAAYTYDILKIFEYLLVGEQQIGAAIARAKELYHHNLAVDRTLLLDVKSARDYIQQGILLDLVKQAVNVFIVGLKYYPVLLCFELKRKSKICFVLCTFYVWMIFGHYLLTNSFCLLSASNQSFMSEADSKLKYIEPTTIYSAPINETQSLRNTRSIRSIRQAQTNYTASYLMSMEEMAKFQESLFINNIMYEKFLFYAVLCFITMNTTIECVFLLANHLAFKRKRGLKRKTISIASKVQINEHEFSKNVYSVGDLKVIETKHVTNSNDESNGGENSDLGDDYDEDGREVNHEINYTRALCNANRSSNLESISFARYLIEKYIYKPKKYFRFSKQFISTQIIALILLYYITSVVIRKSNLISDLASNLLMLLVNFVFKAASASSRIQTSIVVKTLFSRVSFDIILSCVIASSIYALQILLGIRNYHKHILDAYKGIYVDIPPPGRFPNSKLTSSSLHYSGYSIGYMLWGYLVLFEMTAVVVIVIRFLFGFYLIAESMAKIVLPVLAIFLFKKLLIWYLSQHFIADIAAGGINNRKLYSILNHFNFFFDCFLGSFVCFLRLVKACFAALLFMPRLDYSIFGRALERTDAGFVSYAAFIHMEVNQTHPVKMAFCKLLVDSLKTPKSSNSNQIESESDDDDIDCFESSLVNKSRSRTVKNKWLVAYTLLKHPRLRKERKKHLRFKKFIPEVESFERYLERKGIFLSLGKKRSQSTPSLNSYESDQDSEFNSNFNKNLVQAQNPRNATTTSSFSTHGTDFTNEFVSISNELSTHSHLAIQAEPNT